jgi:hypothetical protein
MATVIRGRLAFWISWNKRPVRPIWRDSRRLRFSFFVKDEPARNGRWRFPSRSGVRAAGREPGASGKFWACSSVG